MTAGAAGGRRLFVPLDPDQVARAAIAAAVAGLRHAAGPAGRGLRFADLAQVFSEKGVKSVSRS